jgi:hypothetical protein
MPRTRFRVRVRVDPPSEHFRLAPFPSTSTVVRQRVPSRLQRRHTVTGTCPADRAPVGRTEMDL